MSGSTLLLLHVATLATTSAHPIIGGAPTSGHPAVVAVVDVDGGAYCSGLLVEPDLVLTAAHCVVIQGAPVMPDGVVFGQWAADPSQRLGVDAVWVAPSYRPGVLLGDAALLRLSGDAAVEPAPWPGAPPAQLVGLDIELVGFGMDAAGQLGVKREVVASIASADATSFRYDDGSCYGDSGGPVFLAGSGEPLGIISSGHRDCSGGRAVRIEPLMDELAEGAAALRADGCNAQRSATGPGWLVASAALAAFVSRRRRRRLDPATPTQRRSQHEQ